MWSVVFYPAEGVARVLDRFDQEGEARAHKQRVERLLPPGFQIDVVFEEISEQQVA